MYFNKTLGTFFRFFIISSRFPALPGDTDPEALPRLSPIRARQSLRVLVPRQSLGTRDLWGGRPARLFGPSHKSLMDFVAQVKIYVRFDVQ
jgi:hypothetical protein